MAGSNETGCILPGRGVMRRSHILTALLSVASSASFAQQAPTHADQMQHTGQMPDHMEHRFDNPEESARQFEDPTRDEWQMPERVIATLGLKPGNAVADIGSGTGYFSVRLAKSATHPKVFGSDIEPAMVKYLKDRVEKEGLKNVVPVLASATSPNLPEAVDVILIVDTYHHIGSRAAYFRQLGKSLKPGGRIAIIDFKEDSPEGPPKEFRISFARFSQEMTEAGYRLAAHPDFLPRQQFLIFELARSTGK
jgi:cyclopropane fatty-acyl-phospholipid synthase-like methyltransferase